MTIGHSGWRARTARTSRIMSRRQRSGLFSRKVSLPPSPITTASSGSSGICCTSSAWVTSESTSLSFATVTRPAVSNIATTAAVTRCDTRAEAARSITSGLRCSSM